MIKRNALKIGVALGAIASFTSMIYLYPNVRADVGVLAFFTPIILAMVADMIHDMLHDAFSGE